MKNRTHLYVSHKNVLTWLMALCLVGSAVARIVITGVKGIGYSQDVLGQILLPIVATLLFVLITLISGREFFYKTAIPVFLMAIYYAIRPHAFMSNGFVLGMYYTCLFFFCVIYTVITSGKIGYPWLLFFLFALPVAAIGYVYHTAMNTVYASLVFWMLFPDVLLFAGCFLLVFAIQLHPRGEYHPTWGDRPDGRKIRTIPPMDQVSPYIQVNRNACSNHFEESFEITNVDRYIRQKRREGLTDFGITHVLLAAYVRGVAKYPKLNRFISGQKVFSRGEDIQYCMVVKKEMSVESPDTSIKIHLNPHDTAKDVYDKLNSAVESVKHPVLDSAFDSVVQLLTLIPGVVLKFVVWLLKLLDYFGLLPKFLLEVSPFHGSLFFTSMGSLGIRPIYHHLYDFGNLPVFGAFGCKRRALEVQEDGSVVQKKYIDVKFVLDERIVDGYYYATFFKYYRRILMHPEILDNPPEEVVPDIE